MQQFGDPAAVDQKWINASMEIHFRRGEQKVSHIPNPFPISCSPWPLAKFHVTGLSEI